MFFVDIGGKDHCQKAWASNLPSIGLSGFGCEIGDFPIYGEPQRPSPRLANAPALRANASPCGAAAVACFSASSGGSGWAHGSDGPSGLLIHKLEKLRLGNGKPWNNDWIIYVMQLNYKQLGGFYCHLRFHAMGQTPKLTDGFPCGSARSWKSPNLRVHWLGGPWFPRGQQKNHQMRNMRREWWNHLCVCHLQLFSMCKSQGWLTFWAEIGTVTRMSTGFSPHLQHQWSLIAPLGEVSPPLASLAGVQPQALVEQSPHVSLRRSQQYSVGIEQFDIFWTQKSWTAISTSVQRWGVLNTVQGRMETNTIHPVLTWSSSLKNRQLQTGPPRKKWKNPLDINPFG